MADTNNEATSPAPMALIIKGRPVGVPVPVDAELDPDSDNPVSNKAIIAETEAIKNTIRDFEDISKWTDVTNQCTRTVEFVYLRVLDNGFKYRISFTVLNAAGVQHSIFKLPKVVSERMVFPLVGDNGNGTTTGAIGNLICIGTNDVLISSAGATSFFSDIVEVYHV